LICNTFLLTRQAFFATKLNSKQLRLNSKLSIQEADVEVLMGKGKWTPWSGVDEFRHQVERLLEEGQAGARPRAGGYVWAPLADVRETSQAFIAQVELPGIKAEQVVVEIVDGDLVVRGERPYERGLEPGEQGPEAIEPVYHLIERAHGTFARRFPLPPGVDSESVTACLSEGLLTITVPKGRTRIFSRYSLIVK
jgi:HSP20 family protein